MGTDAFQPIMTPMRDSQGVGAITVESHGKDAAAPAESSSGFGHESRIALLTPYSGGNLGDAAIQDALIANIRIRQPKTRFSGISLDNENFLSRHGDRAFPLSATDRPYYSASHASAARLDSDEGQPGGAQARKQNLGSLLTRPIRKIPVFGQMFSGILMWARMISRELRHSIGAYRFLQGHDLLIVSGGGQLDEEWGGPWGHPFSLFKWAVVARMSGVPFVIASVGACKLTSRISRFFIAGALRRARYRSFRDRNSAAIAESLLQKAAPEHVVPDIAFSMPLPDVPPPSRVSAKAKGRRIIAISPIVYAKPGSWPHEDRALYDQYLDQMALVVIQLLERDYLLLFVKSSRADQAAISDLVARLEGSTRSRAANQILIAEISTWQELLIQIQESELLIASRLHSIILGFVADKAAVAISFDPKVDWVMEDLAQSNYVLQIANFSSDAVIASVEHVLQRQAVIKDEIVAYKHGVQAAFDSQYDFITGLVAASHGA